MAKMLLEQEWQNTPVSTAPGRHCPGGRLHAQEKLLLQDGEILGRLCNSMIKTQLIFLQIQSREGPPGKQARGPAPMKSLHHCLFSYSSGRKRMIAGGLFMNLLIVEDDARMLELLRRGLGEE